MRRAVFLPMLFALGLTATPAQAMISRIISYQELFQKADLIVVAFPTKKTRVTGERTYFADLISTDSKGIKSPLPAVGMETPFHVLTVVKGDPSIKSLVLHHYGELTDPNAKGLSLDGPFLVSFDPDNDECYGEFLLFLVREKDGRYAPYGGQSHPTSSIFSADGTRPELGKCKPELPKPQVKAGQ